MDEEEKELYNMKLHQQMVAHSGDIVLRVAGGWIYRPVGSPVGTFVPFNSEFEMYDNE